MAENMVLNGKQDGSPTLETLDVVVKSFDGILDHNRVIIAGPEADELTHWILKSLESYDRVKKPVTVY